MKIINENINVLVLAASKTISSNQRSHYPSCLTEIKNKSILEHIAENIKNIKNKEVMFAFLESEIKKFHLKKISSLILPNSSCTKVPEETKGSGCTALLSACKLDQDHELLILSANELVNVDLNISLKSFRSQNYDAGTIIFESVHPRYSFVNIEDGLVVQAEQRKPISSNATAGVFWFKKTSYFVEAMQKTIIKKITTDNNYFIAPSFNQLILDGKLIGVHKINNRDYIPLKNEKQTNDINLNIRGFDEST